MESISDYGQYGGSDDEQETSSNSKTRDNPSTKHHGNNYQSRGHSASDASGGSRRRKAADDTNYEQIQMDLSEDSDSSEAHSSPAKNSDVKPPKKCETDFMPQSSHRSDRHNRSDDKSSIGSSKEVDRYKSDKSKESSSRARFAEKTKDKYRNRDRERDRDRDRHSRDKGRSRPEKDDKYSRHRDNRSDSRRDRNDRTDRNEQRRSDKDRYDRGRDRHNTTRSKSKSRSRSRDNVSRDNGSRDNITRHGWNGSDTSEVATARSHQHDRSAIKEPPKSLMSLQLPQMPLITAPPLATKQITPAAAAATTTTSVVAAAVALPNLISPLLASARYTEQMQKRKLLWGNKKVEGEQQTTNNRWEQTKFSQDSDGKMATKFLRLMGMKDAPKVDDDETQKAPDSIKKQTEMLSTMEHQYEVARQMTHTMRGMGLGFGTQPRNY